MKRCRNDAECPASTAVCTTKGYCAECESQSDCPDVYHCTAGRCELDQCEPGEHRCQSDAKAVISCTTQGELDVKACRDNETCSGVGSESACVTQLCSPGAWSCEGSQKAALCSKDGLSFEEVVNCSDSDRVCLEGQCRAPVCESKAWSCGKDSLYRCNAAGTAEALVKTCASGTYCDSEAGDCITGACTPNALSCDGNWLRACNAEGTGYAEEGTDCSATGQLCVEGSCRASACDQEYQCQGSDSYRCVEGGSRLALDKKCDPLGAPAEYCNPESGQCEPVVCAPGQPVCDEKLATVCLDDGSGPSDQGIDCAAQGLTCWEGECLLEICSQPFRCDGEKLYECIHDGTELLLIEDCQSADLCDAGNGVCLAQLCTPGEPACSGATAGTCDETGHALEPGGTDCSKANRACRMGECVERVCAPDAFVCVDGDVHRCDGSGGATELIDACSTGEHCLPGVQQCVPDRCAAGSPVCDGSRATTCLADGSGPSATGTDCSANGQLCYLGMCRNLICEPSARYCKDGQVRQCSTTGLASSPEVNCLETEFCEASGFDARCVPDRCAANQQSCDGEWLALCNADGSGVASKSADCAADGLLCTLDGQCAARAEDTVGNSTVSASNPFANLYLTVVEATTSRRLSDLTTRLGFSAGTPLDFVIYEASSWPGTFTRKWLSSVSAVSTTPGTPTHVTPDFVLLQGKIYALGVLVHAAHQSAEARDGSSFVSFGRVLGEVNAPLTTVPSEPGATLDIMTLRPATTSLELVTLSVN
ncbi:MAG TPA: hypothetical protein VFQ61_38760 [Polyangiaceae bacterium]|nr:hypothetical protein [Polyangiaceae bacterium]